MDEEKETTEEKVQRLKSVAREARRTVLVFEAGEYDDRVSCFEPDIPELEIGKTYRYTVLHRPRGDGTSYHNLARQKKDGPYVIEAVPDVPKQAVLPEVQVVDERRGYFATKEKRDAERERLYEMRLPYINAVAMLPAVGLILAGMMQHKEGFDDVRLKGVKAAARQILAELEEVAEERLPDNARYGAGHARP